MDCPLGSVELMVLETSSFIRGAHESALETRYNLAVVVWAT